MSNRNNNIKQSLNIRNNNSNKNKLNSSNSNNNLIKKGKIEKKYTTSNVLENAKSFFIKHKEESNLDKYLTGIGERVKSALDDEYNILAICILLGLLFILIVILYKNIFNKLETKSLNKVNYYQKLKVNPRLNVCSQLEKTEQYRLCDYYIASSYNTPCIGKPHFDYISNDMYSKILNSGARYIQLPICSKSVEYDTIPIVGTAENNKSLITSLNTLDLNEVLTNIRSYAFKYVKYHSLDSKGKEELALGSINYPLFIHLQIHTHNDLVLNKAYDSIKNILGSYLLNNDKYYNYPLSLEKLCNLTNKIILISTPGYETSELTNIVVPTRFCFRSYIFEELEESYSTELSQDQVEDYYKRNISFISQKKAYDNLENIKKNIIDILEDNNKQSSNSSKILEDLFNNKHFEYGSRKQKIFKNTVSKDDLFLMYNMIGLTLIEPQSDSSSITNNPNTMLAFTNGCHFISMNYHLNDENMLNYINIFQKSSFVLKPSGLRLGLTDENVVDLLEQYNVSKLNITKLNIIPNFLMSLANEFILLEEVVSPDNKVVSHSNTGIIKFNKLSKDSNNIYTNITNNNTFKVIPSSLSKLNDCVHLVTINGLAITINSNFETENANEVFLAPLAKNMKDLQYQTFYPEEGLIKQNENSEIMIQNSGKLFVSFRVYNLLLENKKNNNNLNNNNNKILKEEFEYYLGFERNNIKLLTKKKENLEFCSFAYYMLKSKITIQLEHMNFGGIIINNISGSIYASRKKKINDASNFEVLNYKGPLVNDDFKEKLLHTVVLRNNQGKLFKVKNNKLYLDTETNIKESNIFLIGKENIKDEQIVIMDINGNVLSCNQNGILEFKLDLGNNIGVQKYFNIKYNYNTFNI